MPHSTRSLLHSLQLLPLLTSTLLLYPAEVHTQKLTTSDMDFTTVPNWKNYRQCVRDCFMAYCALQCSDILGPQVGCDSAECLCGDKPTFDLGVTAALSCVKREMGGCGGNAADQKAAKEILTHYCANEGWDYSGSIDETSTPKPTQTKTPSNTDSDDSDSDSKSDSDSDSKSDSDSNSINNNENNININNGGSGGGGGGGSSFGTGEIIGTVVGIVGLLVSIVGVYVTWKARARKQQRLKAQQAQVHEQESAGMAAGPLLGGPNPHTHVHSPGPQPPNYDTAIGHAPQPQYGHGGYGHGNGNKGGWGHGY